jgi:hypothetical protein
MKCIKNKKTGEIERVTDKEAYNKVGSAWSYVAKTEWKAVTRKVKVNEVVETQSETESETIAEKQLKRKKVKDEKGK